MGPAAAMVRRASAGDRCTRRQAVRPARTLAKKGNIPVGYYKDEKKTAETFRTINGVRYAIPGDYAQVEEDGTVTMLGRGSVSINSGGEKVYPEEVEAALKGHPDVFDALVVGVPDPRYGQQVAAVVQARPGCRPSLAELDSFVRSEIAGYKVPRSLWFVDEVKRSPAGKPDYRWAKEQTEARPADDVHAGHVTSGCARSALRPAGGRRGAGPAGLSAVVGRVGLVRALRDRGLQSAAQSVVCRRGEAFARR